MTPSEVEMREYLHTRDLRRRIFPRALLVGALSGALAIAFRLALQASELARDALLAIAHRIPNVGWALPVALSALGAAAATGLVLRVAPEAAGSGIPHLEAFLRGYRSLDGRRLLPVKFLGGVFALGAGLALGREGPTVQLGAALSDLLSKRLRAAPGERRILVAAGAGAGLAAAFNAPLSGLIFVLEEVQRDFQAVVFGAAFVAAAAADIVARTATGSAPAFVAPAYPAAPLAALPVCLALGIAAGLLGVVFNRGLLASLDLGVRLHRRIPPIALAGIVGGAVGLVGWFVPEALGSGHRLAESAMAGRIATAALPAWFAGRLVLTFGSYATGAPGGVFAPLLALGALLGLGIGDIAHTLAPHTAPQPALFAVVGMGAFFASVVRAPLTGIVLILEMTGSYAQMLPLLVACFAAYTVAEALGDHPLYEALLERDLSREP